MSGKTNEILENTMAKLIYDSFIKDGLSHEDALNKTISSVDDMRSESLSEDCLEAIKKGIFKVKGTWY